MMSNKITFDELVESISAEAGRSKTFTHDFVKDLVTTIHHGLMEDEKVNIAQFGKFELRQMDEKEGYNPQKEQKITIPAHRKAVFKPYKNIRERVNAPFLDREPKPDDKDQEQQEASFTPTAPPAEVKTTAQQSHTAKAASESTAKNGPATRVIREFSGLIGAGIALAAATAGAWFFFKKDK